MIKIVKILGLAATVWSASKAMDDGNDISKMQEQLKKLSSWCGWLPSSVGGKICSNLPSAKAYLKEMEETAAKYPEIKTNAEKSAIAIAKRANIKNLNMPALSCTHVKGEGYVCTPNDEEKRQTSILALTAGIDVMKQFKKCLIEQQNKSTIYCDTQAFFTAKKIEEIWKNNQ